METISHKSKRTESVQLKDPAPFKSSSSINKVRKVKKATEPAPYSKEYMKQKWGSTVKDYARTKRNF